MLRILGTVAMSAALFAAGLTSPTLAEPAASVSTANAVSASAGAMARVLTARDKQEIEFIVHSHVAAMTSGDAGIVYFLASPELKRKFPNPLVFFRFVAQVNKPLTTAKAIQIGNLDGSDALKPVQVAVVRDKKGTLWSVHWTLQRDAEGTWRISNCRIFLAHGVYA